MSFVYISDLIQEYAWGADGQPEVGDGRDGLHSLVHTGANHKVSNLELERVEMVCIVWFILELIIR